MKGYKGFNKDLKCRDKQYEVGETYEEEEAKLCDKGLHFTEYPLDTFNYYPPNDSRYAEIEAEDTTDEKSNDDSKRVCKKLLIKAELSIANIVKAAIEIISEPLKEIATSGYKAHSATSGNYAHSATSGYKAHSATSGNYAHSATSGNYAHSATSGDEAHSATSGDEAHSATSGNYAHSATSGNYAHSATSGNYAHSATSGNYAHSATSGYKAHSATSGYKAHSATSGYKAHSATSGDEAHSAVKGKNSIAVSLGVEGQAAGAMGCWITLAEWKQCKNNNWEIETVKSAKVDGKKIKPDTYYMLVDGKFIEVNEVEEC